MPEEPLSDLELDTLCRKMGELNKATLLLRLALASAVVPQTLLDDSTLTEAAADRLAARSEARMREVLRRWNDVKGAADIVAEKLKP